MRNRIARLGLALLVAGLCQPAGLAQESLAEGILVLVETDQRVLGIFADRLLGVQEIVVKPVPKYIQQLSESNGISGCTLLGDGSISLVLDAQQLGKAVYTS